MISKDVKSFSRQTELIIHRFLKNIYSNVILRFANSAWRSNSATGGAKILGLNLCQRLDKLCSKHSLSSSRLERGAKQDNEKTKSDKTKSREKVILLCGKPL